MKLRELRQVIDNMIKESDNDEEICFLYDDGLYLTPMVLSGTEEDVSFYFTKKHIEEE